MHPILACWQALLVLIAHLLRWTVVKAADLFVQVVVIHARVKVRHQALQHMSAKRVGLRGFLAHQERLFCNFKVRKTWFDFIKASLSDGGC